MITTVYLAGLISTEKPASLVWRHQAAEALAAFPGVRVLSPMRGKENLVQTSKDGGITDPALTPKDITFRDYADIRKADVLLTCLDDFGSDRPLVGTVAELAWAWEMRKPVVVFAATPLMVNHPFIREFVSHYCRTLSEAVGIVLSHYSYPVEEFSPAPVQVQ